MFVVFATLLWRLTAGQVPRTTAGAAVRWGFVLSTAYAVAAPYSLPWYDQLTWAALPVLAASALDLVLLARLTVLGLAYVPGRVVAMTPDVQQLTLGSGAGSRRTRAARGLALTAVGRRGSRPTDGPRQAGRHADRDDQGHRDERPVGRHRHAGVVDREADGEGDQQGDQARAQSARGRRSAAGRATPRMSGAPARR